jgi:hypothetical protein
VPPLMLPVLSWEALVFGIPRDRWEGIQLKCALADHKEHAWLCAPGHDYAEATTHYFRQMRISGCGMLPAGLGTRAMSNLRSVSRSRPPPLGRHVPQQQ